MSVPAIETAAGAIERACSALADLHVLPTLVGARTADLLTEILQAAAEQQAAIECLVTQLLDTQNELDNQMGT